MACWHIFTTGNHSWGTDSLPLLMARLAYAIGFRYANRFMTLLFFSAFKVPSPVSPDRDQLQATNCLNIVLVAHLKRQNEEEVHGVVEIDRAKITAKEPS